MSKATWEIVRDQRELMKMKRAEFARKLRVSENDVKQLETKKMTVLDANMARALASVLNGEVIIDNLGSGSQSFSSLLYNYREQEHLTVNAMADKLGVDASLITEIEAGRRILPTPEMLAAMTDFFSSGDIRTCKDTAMKYQILSFMSLPSHLEAKIPPLSILPKAEPAKNNPEPKAPAKTPAPVMTGGGVGELILKYRTAKRLSVADICSCYKITKDEYFAYGSNRLDNLTLEGAVFLMDFIPGFEWNALHTEFGVKVKKLISMKLLVPDKDKNPVGYFLTNYRFRNMLSVKNLADRLQMAKGIIEEIEMGAKDTLMGNTFSRLSQIVPIDLLLKQYGNLPKPAPDKEQQTPAPAPVPAVAKVETTSAKRVETPEGIIEMPPAPVRKVADDEDAYKSSVAAVAFKWRSQKGMTQRELSERYHIEGMEYSVFEGNKAPASPAIIEALADIVPPGEWKAFPLNNETVNAVVMCLAKKLALDEKPYNVPSKTSTLGYALYLYRTSHSYTVAAFATLLGVSTTTVTKAEKDDSSDISEVLATALQKNNIFTLEKLDKLMADTRRYFFYHQWLGAEEGFKNRKTIGYYFAKHRTLNGYSVPEVASKYGLANSDIRRIENGELGSFNAGEAKAIAEIVPLYDLFHVEDCDAVRQVIRHRVGVNNPVPEAAPLPAVTKVQEAPSNVAEMPPAKIVRSEPVVIKEPAAPFVNEEPSIAAETHAGEQMGLFPEEEPKKVEPVYEPVETPTNLADYLSQYRAANGLTCAALGKMVGLCGQTIINIEKNNGAIRGDTIEKLSKIIPMEKLNELLVNTTVTPAPSGKSVRKNPVPAAATPANKPYKVKKNTSKVSELFEPPAFTVKVLEMDFDGAPDRYQNPVGYCLYNYRQAFGCNHKDFGTLLKLDYRIIQSLENGEIKNFAKAGVIAIKLSSIVPLTMLEVRFPAEIANYNDEVGMLTRGEELPSADDYNNPVGFMLRLYRDRNGLSQAKAAERLNLTKATFSRVEHTPQSYLTEMTWKAFAQVIPESVLILQYRNPFGTPAEDYYEVPNRPVENPVSPVQAPAPVTPTVAAAAGYAPSMEIHSPAMPVRPAVLNPAPTPAPEPVAATSADLENKMIRAMMISALDKAGCSLYQPENTGLGSYDITVRDTLTGNLWGLDVVSGDALGTALVSIVGKMAFNPQYKKVSLIVTGAYDSSIFDTTVVSFNCDVSLLHFDVAHACYDKEHEVSFCTDGRGMYYLSSEDPDINARDCKAFGKWKASIRRSM